MAEKKVRCPKCRAVFAASPADDADRESPRKEGSSWPLVLAIGCGVILVLGLGFGVLAIFGLAFFRMDAQRVAVEAEHRAAVAQAEAVDIGGPVQNLPAIAGNPVAAPGALVGEWPQWRGPDRSDVSKETGLLKSWPKQGPKLLWTFENAGIGFSGPAIVGDRLYCIGGDGEVENLFALDTKTGQQLWTCKVGPMYFNGYGDGPRGTPTVDGDLVYGIGGHGDLVCATTATGQERWRVGLQKDLGGQMMSGWGYSESPLVDGGKVVCSPGGPQGTLAALDKKTGKVRWRSKGLNDAATYSSIIAAEVGGLRQYIQMTRGGAVGVAANDGRLLWQIDLAVNGTAIIPTPVFHDNRVYVSAGYGAGGGLIQLTPNGQTTNADKVWGNTVMVNQHGGVLRVGDQVYGYSDSGGWVCQDLKTGNALWTERRLGKGSVTCADGHLYCYTEGDGTVALVEASPEKWKETGRFKIPKTTGQPRKGSIWTHPVVANGRLYLRDHELIFCYDVKGTP